MAQADKFDPAAIFSEWGVKADGTAEKPAEEAKFDHHSVFKEWGVDPDKVAVEAPKPAAPSAPPRPPISGFDQNTPEVAALQARPSATPEGGGFQKDVKEIGRAIVETPGNIAKGTAENFKAGVQMVQSGAADLRNGNIAPSFPSSDPTTWEAGGALKTVGGAVAMPMAPIAATTNRLIGQPVTELTGSPDIGNRAEFAIPGIATSAVASKLAKAATPANQAINRLVEHIGPENVPEVVNRLQNNPRLRLADVAPVVGTTAQGLIDPALPAAQRALTTSVKDSIKGAKPSVEEAFNETMGARPGVVKLLDEMKQKATDAGKNIIEPAIENAQPVPTKSILRALDKQIGSPEAIRGETPRIPLDPTQIKLLQLRKSITDGEMAPLNERVGLSIGAVNDAIKTGGMSAARLADFTEARRLMNSARRGFTSEDDLVSGLKDLASKQKITGPIDDALAMIKKGPVEVRGADFMHGIQSRLRETAQGLNSSSVGSERLMSKDLFDARETLVAAIDKAAGGTYRPGLSKYRDAKQIEESFDKGADFGKQSTGAKGLREDHPEIYAKELSAMSPEELTAHKLGVRLAIDQTMNGYKFGARRGTDIGEVPFKRDKLALLFGKNEADKLFQKLQDERDIASTNSKILQGSKTAETRAAQESMKPREVKPLDIKPSLSALLPAAAVEYGSNLAGLPMGVGGGLAVAAGVAGGVARKAIQVARNRLDIGTNNSYARLASGSDVTRSELINKLLAHPDVVRAQRVGSGNKLLDMARTLGRSVAP